MHLIRALFRATLRFAPLWIVTSSWAGDLPFGPGERLVWDVRYKGVVAGSAWAEVREGEGGRLLLVGGCKSASWYERIYSISDEIESLWDPSGSGSTRYRTKFREGGFHQDQRMDFQPGSVQVWRNQEFKDGWRETVDSYASTGPLEDPQSAFYRIRTLPLESGSTYRFPVFSGKRTWTLEVFVGPRETSDVGGVPTTVIPTHVKTRHKGDVEQKGDLVLFLTDDSRRIPVKLVMNSNVGAIRADLREARYSLDTPQPAGTK